MKLLVIGSGGREHAIAWKLSKSPKVKLVYVAPGNGGTNNNRLTNINIDKIELLADFAEKEKISFTVVGPENPLKLGIVNLFNKRGLKIFGPTKEASRLETSKKFAKDFMIRNNIPTAKYRIFYNSIDAHNFINKEKIFPIVIKVNGLANGKGVIIAKNSNEAHFAINEILINKKFGNAGNLIIIEEFLKGQEVSFISIISNKYILPLASSKDYKCLLENNIGPNTGGMGSISPAPNITKKIHEQIMKKIIIPTVNGMSNEGTPYNGFLYAGIIINKEGVAKVLEFNSRMGDPETQSIIVRLKGDFAKILEKAIDGKLNSVKLYWDKRFSITVNLIAHNYPNIPRIGDVINFIPLETNNLFIFHGGTKLINNKLITSSGRVLSITAIHNSNKIAKSIAYEAIKKISFKGMKYRKDIGSI